MKQKVVPLGLEPRMTESKSVVLTYYTMRQYRRVSEIRTHEFSTSQMWLGDRSQITLNTD